MLKRWISIAGTIFFLAVVFCTGFIFFRKPPPAPASDTSKTLIDKPLPQAVLVDAYGSQVDQQVLRKGRVILVFVTTDCDACGKETQFLGTLLDRRKDVRFYGLIPFGRRPESPEAAKQMFPFAVFFDEENSYVRTMGLNRVPVKVFLEDGIIKKGWIGAALTDQAQQSFIDWLDSLPS
jgi:hypothetical protein